MTKLSDEAKAMGKEIADFDKIWKMSSVSERAACRVRCVDMFEQTRPAAYALSWFVGTGRSCVEFERAIVDMSPARFADLALRIAREHGGKSVRDITDAWKSAFPRVYKSS